MLGEDRRFDPLDVVGEEEPSLERRQAFQGVGEGTSIFFLEGPLLGVLGLARVQHPMAVP